MTVRPLPGDPGTAGAAPGAVPAPGGSVPATSVEELRRIAEAALTRAGVPAPHAAMQVSLLMEAELRAQPSHGLLRLPRLIRRIANGVADPLTSGIHSWVGAALLRVDGHAGLGPVVARSALDAVTDRARSTGVATAAVSGANHLGMLAWYVEHVAKRGMVCIALTTSEPLVQPPAGRRPLVGTNPIAIGVPSEPEPFVLDMATSEISMGKVHAHALRGEPLRPGWAFDEDGHPTVDPVRARAGALAPFGGPKGYGLGLGIELLVASMTGGPLGAGVTGTLDSDRAVTKGDVFVVLAPSAAPAHLTAHLNDIRDSGLTGPVAVPGDRARARRRRALTDGVAVPPALLAELRALAGR